MCSFILPFVFLSLGVAAFSDPNLSRRVLHERRSHVPPEWNFARRHDPSAVLPLRFGLTQSNLHRLAEFLNDVSHPESPNYGKHWSAGKVASTFAPSRQSVDAVRGWLIETGIESHRIELSASGGWLKVNATVEEAEGLLNATYHVYSHESGVEHIACESYHLPEHLVPHVDFVMPTIHFDARLPKRSGSGAGQLPKSLDLPSDGIGQQPGKMSSFGDLNQLADCAKDITLLCLRVLYGFFYEPKVPEYNSVAAVMYGSSYRQSDLDLFFERYAPDLYGVSPVMYSIDGGALNPNSSVKNNGEADLDLEYLMGLVTRKQNVTLYQVGDLVEGASFNNFLDAIDGSYCTFEGGDDPNYDDVYPDPRPGGYKGRDCGTVKPTNVISTSYEYDEAYLSPAYLNRQCEEYAKHGLQGVTIVYSSGDRGVAAQSGGGCLNPDGSISPVGKIFAPAFPATCPYVTSVGATQVSPGKTVFDSEDACETKIFSGGGFSNYFAIPDYQKAAVSQYLEQNPPPYPSDIWNSTGKSRAYPDISANGANYVVVVDGVFGHEYGTSASAPVVAAILTMINDARIACGKSTIGYINPAIYSSYFADCFHDITNGTNPGCGTPGFNTSVGWDPVTGLGTPNFPKLLEKWTALP